MLSSAPRQDFLEGHVSEEKFDVKLSRSRWSDSGEGVYYPQEHHHIVLKLSRLAINANYKGRDDYLPLGDVSVNPRGAPLYCRWEPGTHRTVSCMIDLEGLLGQWGEDWRWPDCDPAKLLAVESDAARAGLRQIAQELLSPGFASAATLEITLMFVTTQLLGHLRAMPQIERADERKLTPAQLEMLRAMLMDTPGKVPSIKQLSEVCGLNSRQLAGAYRRTTGTTLRSFVANSRIERAKTLILDPRILVKQVAFDSGFQGPAAFVAAFRKATGLTPLEFRGRTGSS